MAEHALVIRQYVREDNLVLALRVAIQIADDLAAEHGVDRVVLSAAAPPLTDDARFDALVAGITEYRLLQEHLPLPAWLSARTSLEEPWVVSPSLSVDETDAMTPEPLRRRGAYIDASDLESV